MKIVFRVDASIQIGSGHVMRCLALADQLVSNGCNSISFICGVLAGDFCDYIEQRGYTVYKISIEDVVGGHTGWRSDAEATKRILSSVQSSVDWIIVDHYKLDVHWEREMRNSCTHIMVIDDLANRYHDCDLLLDQNYQKGLHTRYDTYVPPYCRKMLGPRYLLLRSEFTQARRAMKERTGQIQRLLIFYGGSDPTNETVKALRALVLLDITTINMDVVVGSTNPNREEVLQLCNSFSSAKFHCQIDNIAELIIRADLALGAGGVAMWERCFLGLPAVTTIVADNQRKSTLDAAEAGVIWNLGWHETVNETKIADIVNKAFASPMEMKVMSRKAKALMYSNKIGTDNRLIEELLGGSRRNE